MKGKYISFLILPSILIAFFLIFSASKATAGLVAPECVANSCGTSVGTKQVPVFRTVCEDGCPTVTFQNTHKVCPAGYTHESQHHDGYCYSGNNPDWPEDYRLMVNQAYGPVYNVIYNKSSDPHKCHRPSDDTLRDFYGMNHDTRNAFKAINSQHMDSIDVNCHQELTGYNTVACNDAPVILCEEQCPSECGYGGGRVPDGNGGYKTCEPTNSCSTHRWCVLQEDDSYLAQAISDSEENPEGKPWVTGMDRYCEYEYEQCSVTNPSYGNWGDWMVDNENESVLVGKRTVTNYDSVNTEVVCSTSVEKQTKDRPLCQYDGATYADDPLCIAEDDGDVLGVTDVVTADTAGGLDSSAYILQFVLVLITSVLFVSVGKEYLKK